MRFKGPPVLAAVAAGLLLAIAATAIFAVRADRDRRDRSDAYRIDALKNAVTTVTAITAGRLQDVSTAVGSKRDAARRAEFERMAKAVITEPDIAAIRLIERVKSSEIHSYERRRGFQVKDWGGHARQGHALHYVSAAEVVRGSLSTNIGADIAHDRTRMTAVNSAINGGRPAATAPTQLLSSGRGEVLYVPVYRAGAPVGTAKQRRAAAIGLVSASLRTALLGEAIQSLTTGDQGFQITDGGQLVANNGGGPQAGDPSGSVLVAGRRWTVSTERTSGSAWPLVASILLGGMTLSLLIAVAIARSKRRERDALGTAARQNAELQVANALLAENARFFEITHDMVCTTDLDGNMLSFNDRWTDVLGWSAEELRNLPVEKRVHPDDVGRVQEALTDLATGDVLVNFRNRRITKDGGWRWLEWSSVSDLKLGMVFSSARDVTKRVELEDELASERAQMAKAQAIANLGSWNYDVRTGKMYWSDELFDVLGIDRPDEPLNVRHWLATLAEDERERAQRQLTETIAKGGDFEFKFRRNRPGPDGKPVHLITSGFAEHDENGKVVRIVGIVADVTERLRSEERLRHIADHDPLTGLANRRRFNDLLAHHVEMCRRYGMEGAVMMLDLDGLKRVNDEHGHATGDELISSTANALRNRLRTSDLGARIGGDEFAILLTRTTRKGALSTAESILKAIGPGSATLRDLGVERVHGSIGVVMIEDAPRAGAEELLALADDAMYQAKRGGGARVKMYRPPLRRPTAA